MVSLQEPQLAHSDHLWSHIARKASWRACFCFLMTHLEQSFVFICWKQVQHFDTLAELKCSFSRMKVVIPTSPPICLQKYKSQRINYSLDHSLPGTWMTILEDLPPGMLTAVTNFFKTEMFWRTAMRPPLLLLWLTEQQKVSHTSWTSLCWKLYQKPTQQLPVQTAQLICIDCNGMYIGAQKAVSETENLLLHALFFKCLDTSPKETHQRMEQVLDRKRSTAQVNKMRVSPQIMWSYTWH